VIARQSLVDGEAGDQLVTLFRSKREDRRSRRSLVAGRIAPARLPKPLHIPTDHPPHVFRHGHPVGTGCANLMRRIIVHAADAARNSVPLCYWVGLGRWRFSTSLSPVRDCSFRAATSRPLSVSFGGPENPWGWASRVTAESASSRPIDPAPARARGAARPRQEGNDPLDLWTGLRT
jgi:hypothetical protein